MAKNPSKEKVVLKKGAWSLEEDEKLISYISRFGIWNWSEIPKQAGLARTSKSCRLRWVNYLKPGIKRGNISKEEEETIVKLHNILGNRWSAIAARLPQRTDNDIKNYWNTRLKKRVVQDNLPSATTSPSETKFGLEAEPENSCDTDSSISLNTSSDLDSPILTFDNFREPTAQPGWNQAAVVDDTNTMEDNFVSSETYWEIQSFMELPLTVVALDNDDCHTMLPNCQLWLHETIYDPVDDFWVSPFI
ncbi:hypothetical protein PTKIN_Ptkin14bG0081400 [Pterospermum kingtungense]